MRRTWFKIIMLFALLIFSCASFVPWCVSNHTLPLWADIFLLAVMFFIWMIGIQYIAKLICPDDKDDDIDYTGGI